MVDDVFHEALMTVTSWMKRAFILRMFLIQAKNIKTILWDTQTVLPLYELTDGLEWPKSSISKAALSDRVFCLRRSTPVAQGCHTIAASPGLRSSSPPLAVTHLNASSHTWLMAIVQDSVCYVFPKIFHEWHLLWRRFGKLLGWILTQAPIWPLKTFPSLLQHGENQAIELSQARVLLLKIIVRCEHGRHVYF